MSAATEALAEAARMAGERAAEFRESATKYPGDEGWIAHCTREEQRALDRAAWYIERKALLEESVEFPMICTCGGICV